MKNIAKLTKMSAAITMVVFGAHTQAEESADLLETLVQKNILTQSEADSLRAKQKASSLVVVDKKGLSVESADGEYSLHLGGRIHADFATTDHEDLAGGAEAIDGTEIRRARAYIKGNAGARWNYVVEADFAGDKVSMKDLSVSYKLESAPFTITAGNQKQAVSMEVEESSNDIMFMERSLVSALSVPYFDRALGVTAATSGQNWHFKTGLFGDNVSGSSADEGYGFGIRSSFAPLLEKERVVHLGASYGIRKTSEDGKANGKSPSFAYTTSHFSGLKPVNVTVADMSEVQLGVLEFAAMNGKWSLQSELARNTVARDSGEDLNFSAAYVQLGYTLFGGQRRYKASDGEFKHFTVESGANQCGAVELATRIDQIDLVDNDVDGGKAKRATVAVNWYPNDNVRIMFDFSRSFDLDGGALKDRSGSPADNIDSFAIRTQWAF